MADSLHELLLPHLPPTKSSTHASNDSVDGHDPTTRSYLERLTTLTLGALDTTERESLSHSAQSSLRSLQALSKRSHGAITSSADHLSGLSALITATRSHSTEIRETIQHLEKATSDFAAKYEKGTDNHVLDRRKAAAKLSRNADRVGSILELPSLLSSTVYASVATDGGGSATVASSAALSGYASALDIHAHVRRLRALYPHSAIVSSVSREADEAVANMLTVLVTTLQTPSLKLAVAMRTIGWLRRVAPELSGLQQQGSVLDRRPSLSARGGQGGDEGSLGSLFLVCRLTTLRRTLQALQPLKELADLETTKRQDAKANSQPWSGGMQSERYLKRFIELFREQSFGIVSMYRSIFPSALPIPASNLSENDTSAKSTGSAVPSNGHLDIGRDDSSLLEEHASALAPFVPELVDLLSTNLKTYMPNISDRSSRDSLLSQVLFCAGSLGRLGADFGMVLALIEEDLQGEADRDDCPEWQDVMKKHKVQAGRLEVLASGVMTGRVSANMPSLDSQMQAAGTA